MPFVASSSQVPAPDGDVVVPFEGALDLRRTLDLHQRGRGDPAMRFEVSGSCWRASRTPEGPVTLYIELVKAAPADNAVVAGYAAAASGAAAAGGAAGGGDANVDEVAAGEASGREASRGGGSVRVRAWGPGTAWAIAQAPGLLGLDDPGMVPGGAGLASVPGIISLPGPPPVPGSAPGAAGLAPGAPAMTSVEPVHRAVADALRAGRGVRIGWTGRVLEALLPAILEQKVTGDEARRAYRGLVARYGEDAPGPPGLRLPPDPRRLAGVPYHALHAVGLERRRAELIAAVCRDAERLERLGTAAAGPDAAGEVRAMAYAALRAYPGVGPWTAAEVGMRAFGDPDAVSVGDFHLPNMVAWALAGEPRGTDERMLELLEPYRGQRGRVVRLLELAGLKAPRYGPRLTPRRIDGI